MTETQPYRVLLALSENHQDLAPWVELALRLAPRDSEIHLRGIVAVESDRSLSEGATRAREWRTALKQLAQAYPAIQGDGEVLVDFHPYNRILDALHALAIDLSLAQWKGPLETTGGLATDEILQHSPCDVVLVHGEFWKDPGPVLLSLRGGPNLDLGLQAATALAGEAPITLFHAADRHHDVPALNLVLETSPHISRMVTALSDITAGILHEVPGHNALVMGATFQQPEWEHSASGPVVERVYRQTAIPLVLVRAWHPDSTAFHIPHVRSRPEEILSTRVDRWFAENTFHSHEFADVYELLALKEKQGLSISIGLPALNEEDTVGVVIGTLKSALMDEVPLVDEIVLIDSDSTDNTIAIAESCGIPVYKHSEILSEVGTVRGKGEGLWKSLHVLEGDIVVWVDTDITNIHPRFIYGLLGPLLKRHHIQYVKGFYQRPIMVGGQLHAYGGGRVTELVARPLLNLFYPGLSGLVQPLSGEYAGRRTALEQVPFFSGYGVETGLLIDLLEHFGLDAIAQTDLEERVHHNQPLVNLSKMSFAILQVFISRLETRYGVQLLDKANRSMKLIAHGPDRFALELEEIGDVERPPMATIPAYRLRRDDAHYRAAPSTTDTRQAH